MAELEERRALAQQVRAEYLLGSAFIEAQFNLEAIELIARSSDVLGVARLTMLQPTVRESVHTLVFKQTAIEYHRVQGLTAFWHSIPKYGFEPGSQRLTEIFGDPFEPQALQQLNTSIECEKGRAPSDSNLPKTINNFSNLKTSAISIGPSGEQDVMGVTYFLSLCERQQRSDIRWCDPTRAYNAKIWHILDAFDFMTEYAETPKAKTKTSEDNSELPWWKRWRR